MSHIDLLGHFFVNLISLFTCILCFSVLLWVLLLCLCVCYAFSLFKILFCLPFYLLVCFLRREGRHGVGSGVGGKDLGGDGRGETMIRIY